MDFRQNSISTLIIAHRGGGGLAPENTLASIEAGIKFNSDIIEIDVHQTKDKKLIVIHDNSIDRTTDGKGLVREMTYDQILQYNIVSAFAENNSNMKIPSLEQVLEFVKGKSGLMIELKYGNPCYPGIEERLVEIIRENHAEDWCSVQSFDIDILKRIHFLEKDLELYFLCYVKLPLIPVWIGKKIIIDISHKYEFLKGINIYRKFADLRTLKVCHHENRKMMVWTVDSKDRMTELLKIGVDGIITNYPNYMRSLLNN